MGLQKQKKDKKKGTSEEDDMSKMEFDKMLEFVKNTTDIETSPAKSKLNI